MNGNTKTLVSVTTTTMGNNKGAPRVWLQGQMPARSGFLPGAKFRVAVDPHGVRVTLSLHEEGSRTVSRKEKGGKEVPVLDINSNEALAILAGYKQIRVIFMDGEIHLLPDAVEARQKERLDRLRTELEEGRLSVGSVSHGAGILSHALHTGFEDESIRSELKFAVDIDPEALEVAASNNTAWNHRTQAIALPVQMLALADPYVLSKLPAVSMLEAGLPCTAASISGKSKKKLKQAEDDPKAGHLVAAFITLIGRLNPAIVLLENVRPWFSTASGAILRTQLRELGYDVQERDLDGRDYAIEDRPRRVLLGVTEGIEVNLDAMVAPSRAVQRIGDILEDVSADDEQWRDVAYLKAKEIADKAAGKGFAMQLVTANDTRVGTIGTGYQKARSTEPRLVHPSNAELSRLFTPVEHARLKGIPPELVAGVESKTTAHALLGQSVVWGAFRHVGQVVGRSLAVLRVTSSALPMAAAA
jgi:DNA (cytosine-5)-methyltransferase 1